MLSINAAVLDLKRLDLLAGGDSPIHALDARAKVLVTLLFIVSVVSFDRYELARLLPFCIFPIVTATLAKLPSRYLLRKIALICPFILMVGIFNPLIDRSPLFQLGTLGISGGWISLVSLLVRSLLTVGAAVVLIGSSGFTAVCRALEQLGAPQFFAMQLLFLHRYMFVLAEEAGRASRARELRSCGKKGRGVASFASLAGHLLLRTWQRAEQVHTAMLARGFSGHFHALNNSRFAAPELRFLLGWSAFIIVLRLVDIPLILGTLCTGILS
ncbi:MAG: cobalt ECF transporter T component CbiQ [Desulfuromonadaceae bacterium]|nr:cobalt ECF transporter T component CbiQ [Desulfuromonadaceae bacterium]MDD5107497.1 cobalt ECF transporter T component CbiQ [Desulfuromonadaceae bacterium]